MNIEIRSIRYEINVNTADQGGVFMEVSTIDKDAMQTVMEVFYSFTTKDFNVGCFRDALPLELVELVLGAAKAELPVHDS